MAHPFFDPVSRYFGAPLKLFGFKVSGQRYAEQGFGSGQVRLESERYTLEVRADGMGPEVSLYIGRKGQALNDLAWIFAYLARNCAPEPSNGAPWLYYFPHLTLGIWEQASIDWQLERLAEILQPMWPAVFVFLDQDALRGADFRAFEEQARREAAERAADSYRQPAGDQAKRAALNFIAEAQKSFNYLCAFGFEVVKAEPLWVRYETAFGHGQLGHLPGGTALYVNVFHRPRSFQVGVHTGMVQPDPALELNFSLAELAAWLGKEYQPSSARTAEELQQGLNRLARLFRSYAAALLGGDARLLQALHNRRIDAARWASRVWAEKSR